MPKYSFFQEMAELKKFVYETAKQAGKDKIKPANADLPNNQERSDIKKNEIAKDNCQD